jgi:hypothetical protein
MSQVPSKPSPPARDLEREARRLKRLRRLRVVKAEPRFRPPEPDSLGPGPKEAA